MGLKRRRGGKFGRTPSRAIKADKSGTVLRFRDFRWRGVGVESYKRSSPCTWSGINRQVLVAGSRGAAIGFDVRYFEIEPGGYSTLETHTHAHVIVGVRGRGRVRIGSRWHSVRHLDTCYIAPRAAHQLRNSEREPFGFFCLVDAERDAAVPLLAEGAQRSKAPRA